MDNCQHPYPEEFGSSDVSWDADGLEGTVILPCAGCGESIRWTVSEPA